MYEWTSGPVPDERTKKAGGESPHTHSGNLGTSEIATELCRLLVVDDDPDIRHILSTHLQNEGFEVDVVSSSRQAIGQMRRSQYRILLCDIRMGGMSGVELLRAIRLFDQQIAIVLISGLNDIDLAVESMKLGADDYIPKPFRTGELKSRVLEALKRREEMQARVNRERTLESTLQDRDKQLHHRDRAIHALFLKGVRSMVMTLEAKDKYTKNHSRKVSEISEKIAAAMGFGPSIRKRIRIAAVLHDIGKIGIDKSILHKEGPLTDEEYALVKEHPLIGERILQPLMQRFPDIVKAVKHEHEKFDGSGYPDGLKGAEIPIAARIIAVADCYDAITSDRPYRSHQMKDFAVKTIAANAGTQFDPEVVEAFVRVSHTLGLSSTGAPPTEN